MTLQVQQKRISQRQQKTVAIFRKVAIFAGITAIVSVAALSLGL